MLILLDDVVYGIFFGLQLTDLLITTNENCVFHTNLHSTASLLLTEIKKTEREGQSERERYNKRGEHMKAIHKTLGLLWWENGKDTKKPGN